MYVKLVVLILCLWQVIINKPSHILCPKGVSGEQTDCSNLIDEEEGSSVSRLGNYTTEKITNYFTTSDQSGYLSNVELPVLPKFIIVHRILSQA